MADKHIATSEADYTHEETELLKAIAKRRQERGGKIMTNIEIFRMLKEMGYVRRKPIPTTAEELPIVRHRQKKILVPGRDAPV